MRGGRSIFRLFSVSVMLVVMAVGALSCGHEDPSTAREGDDHRRPAAEDGTSETPTRPDIGESDGMEKELADDVWRVSGLGADMRYDRGGVLFVTGRDGRVKVTDLDGADVVEIRIGEIGTDSVAKSAAIEVNGSGLSDPKVKLVKRGEGRVWYRVDAGDKSGIVVIP